MRVRHAEGLEQVPLHVLTETLSADRLDRLAGPIDAGAVVPAVAGLEQQRHRQ
jgi:hypothetical protein